jgi:hypothetical protein
LAPHQPWRRRELKGIPDQDVSRLCLDEMRTARRRRETYVGPWLPEPLVETVGFIPEAASEYADHLSIGPLLTLERSTPLQRVPSCCMTCLKWSSQRSQV